jgi:hypothetical protein
MIILVMKFLYLFSEGEKKLSFVPWLKQKYPNVARYLIKKEFSRKP